LTFLGTFLIKLNRLRIAFARDRFIWMIECWLDNYFFERLEKFTILKREKSGDNELNEENCKEIWEFKKRIVTLQ